MFFTESWFWRGTQSAIFFYVSCAPCVDYKYKRQRQKEAQRAEKEKAEIIIKQPGLIMQPGPFQTNPDWTEEIICGPGPPKGWKKDKVLIGFSENDRERYRRETQAPLPPAIDDFQEEMVVSQEAVNLPSDTPRNIPSITFTTPLSQTNSRGAVVGPSSSTEPMSPITEVTSNQTVTSSSSDPAEPTARGRPSMERRLSSAVENLKDTIKGWNFRRYEREDEVLSGLNERLSRMWDKATTYGAETGAEIRKLSMSYGRKRAGTTETTESERVDYQRLVRNPEINEMHPPTVSKLPATRDEAAWMLLPPPSAAVMAGRSRPQAEQALRWPLAQIGRDPSEWEQIKKAREVAKIQSDIRSRSSTNDSKRTPDLSNSSSDESWSDDEGGNERYLEDQKRHSAPVEGWMPMKPIPSARKLYPEAQYWQREEAIRQGCSW